MYYDRIYRIWVIDRYDYFLISAILGAVVAPYVKEYLSEKAATDRLKKSIESKSRLLLPSRKQRKLNAMKQQIKKVYRFALTGRGGQLDDFQASFEPTETGFKLAQEIEKLVTRLAAYLKRRELRGILKIFFKNGRLILELILVQCNINLSYATVGEGLKVQVIVFTSLAGGATGFTIGWITAGATLVSVLFLATLLFAKSLQQQWLNVQDYRRLKEQMKRLLEDPELQQTLIGFFETNINPPMTSGKLEMELLENSKNLPHNLPNSAEDLDALIKAQMENQFGLVENPTDAQLQQFLDQAGQRQNPKPFDLEELLNKFSSEFSEVDSSADDLLDPIDVKFELFEDRPEDGNGFF